jgi:hypothetical protein
MPKFIDGSSIHPFTSSVKAMIPTGSVIVTYFSLSAAVTSIVASGIGSMVGNGVLLNVSVASLHVLSTMCTSMAPGTTSTSATNSRRLASAIASGSDPSVATSKRMNPNSIWLDFRSTSIFRSAPKIVVGLRETTYVSSAV